MITTSCRLQRPPGAILALSFPLLAVTGTTVWRRRVVRSMKLAALFLLIATSTAAAKPAPLTGARLRDRADIKALRLTPSQLDAFVLAIPDLTVADAARRIGEVRRDQEASKTIETTFKTLQDQTLTSAVRQSKLVVMQVAAALARIEEAPVGGRTPSTDGRERAKQLATQALARSPESADAHVVMGDVLTDAKDLDAAEAEYRKGIALADSAWAHARLGNALLLDGAFADAETQLREALRLDPQSVPAHSDLGLVLRSLKKLSDSAAEYRAALALDADFVDAHNGLAVTLAAQGNLPDAVAHFREIVRVDPDSAVGYYNLAYALADMDKDEESAEALREVIRINPNHYNAHYNIGEMFRLEGKYDDSARQFREYLRLAPETPQTRRNIGRAKNFIKQFEND
jgi:tetratricopeptide (TPR) repeat protein